MAYNRKKAVEYARAWALSANPQFYHFGGIGGDCTNYISQCFLAGGAKMNYNQDNGWYYINSYKRSPSWTSVEALYKFLNTHSEGTLHGRKQAINQLEIGDIIQLRQNKYTFNHTLIITKIVNGQIFVCAHSFDALDKPLRNYSFIEARGLHIEI